MAAVMYGRVVLLWPTFIVRAYFRLLGDNENLCDSDNIYVYNQC